MTTYVDLKLEQGSTFNVTFTLVDQYNIPYNVSNFTLQGNIKESENSTTIIKSLTINNPVTGIINISLSALDTLVLTKKTYHYDIIAIDVHNISTRIVKGLINVYPGVTK